MSHLFQRPSDPVNQHILLKIIGFQNIIPDFVNAGALKESSKRETGCTDPAPPLSIRSDAKFEVPTGFLTTGAVGLFSWTRVGGFGAGTGGGGG